MAIIYQRIPAERCDILTSREPLVYPFSFSSEWEEIRIGMFFSAGSINSGNALPVAETLNTNSIKNSIFFGLKNSTSQQTMPSGNDCIYIGIATPQGNSCSISTDGNIAFQSNSAATLSIIDSTGAIFNVGNGTDSRMQYPITIDSTSYAGFYGLILSISANKFSGAMIRQQTPVTDCTLTGLQYYLSGSPNLQTIGTGWFTTGFVGGGQSINRPDSILIYMPFIQNQFRIHNIAAERYA